MSDTKICKQCGFEGDKNKFYRRICIECRNENERQKRYIKLGRLIPPKKIYSDNKTCKICYFIGSKDQFHGVVCLNCYKVHRKIYDKKYNENNRIKVINSKNKYTLNNKDKIKGRNNKPEIKEKNRFRKKIWAQKKRKEKVEFKLRENVSSIIYFMLRKAGGSKNNYSISKYLPYTIKQLKDHLEKLFEPWMTWNNWGKYDPKIWDDNNALTWTWNIDHIIPQSKLLYKSMDHPNFLKCWSLENLRPLSSKQNILDSNRKRIL